MPFSLLVRRTHLYLALFCLPWFVMYGISSFAFSHPEWFQTSQDQYNTSGNAWTEEGSWPCALAAPEGNVIPLEFAAQLLQVAGLEEAAFGAYRSGEHKIDVYFPSFWETRRLSYDAEEQRLSLYSRVQTVQNILTSMHARAGYQHASFVNDVWALMVDVSCISFLLWVITGLYIWWQDKGLRGWGALCFLAGFLAFAGFLIAL